MRTSLVLPLATVVVVANGGLVGPAAPLTGAEPAVARTAGPRVVEVLPMRTTSLSAGSKAVDPSALPAAGLPEVALRRAAPLVTAPRAELLPRGRWSWPLSPRPAVLRPFTRPVTRYGAGHRGVDLAGSMGQVVGAVDAGVVTHVGRIAGRGTVTVLHATGVRSTYEPVDATVAVGAAVAVGTPLGQLAASGSHCEPACLHLGAVRGEVYLDPLVFLVGGRRVRLLPLGQAPDG